VYPLWQPRTGFNDNHEYHSYMQAWYRDRGLENSGLPRPHYEIPEELTYRAKTGEVPVGLGRAVALQLPAHPSHTGNR
jgi:hypothetical protein